MLGHKLDSYPQVPSLGAPAAIGKYSRRGLKSGYPGSAGEPGFGLGWALGGHRGGVTRLPGAPWRAGRNGKLDSYPQVPSLGAPAAIGKYSRRGLKSGYPGSAGEPGFGLGWALGGHRGGVTRLPGAPWRAGRNGRFSFVCLFVFSILFSSPRFEDFPLVPRDSRTPPLTHALWGRG